MSEQNKHLVRRIFKEIWKQGNLAIIDDHFASDYLGHCAGEIQGPEGAKKLAMAMRAAFSDFQYTAEDQIAEGDKVVIRWTVRGTHTGEFPGLVPNGRPVTLTGTDIFRIANGKVIEGWITVSKQGVEVDESKTQNKEKHHE